MDENQNINASENWLRIGDYIISQENPQGQTATYTIYFKELKDSDFEHLDQMLFQNFKYKNLPDAPTLGDIDDSTGEDPQQGFSTVAFTGEYKDLIDPPSNIEGKQQGFAKVAFTGDFQDLINAEGTNDYNDLNNKPENEDNKRQGFSKVAFTGDFNDLVGKPTVDQNGNISNLSYTLLPDIPKYVTNEDEGYENTEIWTPNALAALRRGFSSLAFTGSYNDLIDKPEYHSNLEIGYENYSEEDLENFRKGFSISAFTGSYDDLINKPEHHTLEEPSYSEGYTQEDLDTMRHGFAKVAFTNDYNDLINKFQIEYFDISEFIYYKNNDEIIPINDNNFILQYNNFLSVLNNYIDLKYNNLYPICNSIGVTLQDYIIGLAQDMINNKTIIYFKNNFTNTYPILITNIQKELDINNNIIKKIIITSTSQTNINFTNFNELISSNPNITNEEIINQLQIKINQIIFIVDFERNVLFSYNPVIFDNFIYESESEPEEP